MASQGAYIAAGARETDFIGWAIAGLRAANIIIQITDIANHHAGRGIRLAGQASGEKTIKSFGLESSPHAAFQSAGMDPSPANAGAIGIKSGCPIQRRGHLPAVADKSGLRAIRHPVCAGERLVLVLAAAAATLAGAGWRTLDDRFAIGGNRNWLAIDVISA